MVYVATLPAIVKKMRLNSRLLALIAASKIHSGWIPESPDKDGIYVTPLRGNLNQTVSSANQTNHTLQGSMRWQVDALSNQSIEQADLLARAACEACLPSILTAGIFSLNFSIANISYDSGFMCYRATYRLETPCMEHITG
jgi:hypothetical protein